MTRTDRTAPGQRDPVMAFNHVLNINTMSNLQSINRRLSACVIACIVLVTVFAALFITFLVLWLECRGPSPTPPTPPSYTSYRLPRSLRPLHYDLFMHPFLPDDQAERMDPEYAAGIGTFFGSVSIMIECIHDTSNITLNAAQLNFTRWKLDSAPFDLSAPEFNQETSMVTFYLHTPHERNATMFVGQQFTLEIDFNGKLRDDMDSFYWDTYQEDGVNKSYAVTQFESESARLAFPCFDEPEYKATFYVQLAHSPDKMALSNSNVMHSSPWKHRGVSFEVTYFNKTPVMSSYLVAFFVGEFSCKNEVVSNTTRHTVYTSYRLPRSLRPLHYDLFMHPFLPDDQAERMDPEYAAGIGTFFGSVSIMIECIHDTSNITLNAAQLNFTRWKLDSAPFDLSAPEFNQETSMVTFYLHTPHERNATMFVGQQFTLEIDFNGKLRDDMDSFYWDTYQEDGVNKSYAVTQFESESARLAFPCFDEPEYKATFYVQLAHSPDKMALSNSNVMHSSPWKHRGVSFEVTYFNKTPVMSSYLVAFFVGEFSCKNEVVSNTTRHTVFRACMRNSLDSQGGFAADFGARVLAYYESYYNVEFPLAKMDLLALPSFSAGAMENWGLVTFREQDVLYDEQHYPPTQRRQVASVIAHELAHQWFGDLVTMRWWSDLWLNEGFADFMSFQAVDAVFNDQFQMSSQLVFEETQGAFEVDQYSNSHPVHHEVVKNSDILFDTIDYNKGCGFLNMLSHSLPNQYNSSDVFRAAIHDYLMAEKYGNADYNTLAYYLYQAIQRYSVPNIDIYDFLDRWILQEGFPVVTVTRPDSSSLRLSSHVFTIGTSNRPPSKYSYEWPVYHDTIAYSSTGDYNHTYLYVESGKNGEMSFPFSITHYWLSTKAQNFVRILYDSANYRNLIKNVLTQRDHLNEIDVRVRSQLIDDAFNLANAHLLDYKTAFCVSAYLGAYERASVPWLSYFSNLDYIGRMLSTPSVQKTLVYNTYISNVTSQAWSYANQDAAHALLDTVYWDVKLSIYKFACASGYEPCTSTVLPQYDQYANACSQLASSNPNCNKIQVLLRPVVYCTAVAIKGKPAFDFLVKKYKTELINNEKRAILTGLSCAKDKTLFNRLLQYTLDGYIDDDQDRYVYTDIVSNPLSSPTVWNYFVKNYDFFIDSYHGGLSEVISAATANFNTQEEYNEVKSFLASHPDLGDSAVFKESLSRIQGNIEWSHNHVEDVVNVMHMFEHASIPSTCLSSS